MAVHTPSDTFMVDGIEVHRLDQVQVNRGEGWIDLREIKTMGDALTYVELSKRSRHLPAIPARGWYRIMRRGESVLG